MVKKTILTKKITVYNCISSNCKYYSDQQFDENLCGSHNIDCGSMSFVHFNSRSLNVNFENICNYIDSLNIAFDIIAVSETWVKTDQMCQFDLRSYST